MMTKLEIDVRQADHAVSNAHRCGTLLLALLVLFVACGCRPVTTEDPAQNAASATTAASAKKDADTSSVTINSVNYMHERAVHYTLYDLSTTPPTAVGDSIVNFLATGGDQGCCLALPKTWHPGIKVRLDWFEEDRDRTYPEKYSRELEIPRYQQPADLYAVFYPKNEVELVVSPSEPGGPDWRGRIKQTPWDQCVANYGRKLCKIALPKQFDTNARGICTFFKQQNRPDSEANCFTLMHQCMQDYEDEPFCKGILWAPYEK